MTVININPETIFINLYNKAVEIGCKATLNEPLCNHTSFKTGGACPVLIEPCSTNQLIEILKFIKANNIPYTVMGNGTNLLALDCGLNKAVIKISDAMSEITLIDDETILCSAGTKMVTLCKFALENSLSGLEFAYGIPGTCGGAVFMNAGAYGGEVKDVITEITHITPDLKLETIKTSQAHLSYRHSIYKSNGCIIVSAKIKLKKAEKEAIKAAMDAFLSRRKSKQPLEYPSAGSTFKRPEGHFAGALIEQCNLKGFSIGGAQVSEKHAGFVINKGGATAQDILDLMAHIEKTVKTNTGVTLEPEVIVLR